jgi:hypothetical protein
MPQGNPLVENRAILDGRKLSKMASNADSIERQAAPRPEAWTIEDEQWQRIGGGYKAVKFRFLLFL